MYEIRVDEEKCCAYGNCVVAAPDVFALGETDKVIVLQPEFPSVPPHVYRAVRSCPAYALTVGRAEATEER
ncbi:ferredoxin [Amycolatopsis rubida]|uniref:Ferredoxin n=1 Tax=Amycolatopsis rubida TaxID=112413 RepID=A0ABX0BSN4_9PSEU|nr:MULTISPECIES: ferredoxin [Amycolatopsis]MYW92997.1 ferredoxin [Amycolatopsis rubida]NEC57984.1 ferredoxin [Amycolatopsis rubida]OAP25522.1 Ferredoxin-2 [Amycolatopsis sp. M39]